MSARGVSELLEWVRAPETLSAFMAAPLEEEIRVAYHALARRVHPRLHMAGLSARGAVLALRCDGGLEHVLAGMREAGREELRSAPEAWEQLVQLCSERGTRWVERLIKAAGDGDLDAHPLLARLVADHGLPEPEWFRLARLGRPDGVGVVPEVGDEVLWYRHLMGALDSLPQSEREGTRAAVVESLTSHSAWHPWQLGDWAVPLLVRLGATAEQVSWRWREWPVPVLAGEPAPWHDEFLAAVRERGRGFAAEIVAAAVTDPLALRGAIYLLELLIVRHGLPLPTAREYWEAWWQNASTPRVGRRWQEQFLAACTIRDALAPFTTDSEERIAEVAEAAAGVRAAGEIDDVTLTGVLIAVWERGDRVSSQRAVVQWIQALGLVDRLRDEQARLIAALPVLEGAAGTFVVELLLAGRLTEAELTEIAVIVLPRGPKALARRVLDALGRLDSASGELLETVRLLAEDSDARIARKAQELRRAWGSPGC